jgi:hypothetical protein
VADRDVGGTHVAGLGGQVKPDRHGERHRPVGLQRIHETEGDRAAKRGAGEFQRRTFDIRPQGEWPRCARFDGEKQERQKAVRRIGQLGDQDLIGAEPHRIDVRAQRIGGGLPGLHDDGDAHGLCAHPLQVGMVHDLAGERPRGRDEHHRERPPHRLRERHNSVDNRTTMLRPGLSANAL